MGSMEKGDLARIQIRLIGFCMMVVDGITGGIAMVRQRLREQQRARGKTLDPDGTGFKGICPGGTGIPHPRRRFFRERVCREKRTFLNITIFWPGTILRIRTFWPEGKGGSDSSSR